MRTPESPQKPKESTNSLERELVQTQPKPLIKTKDLGISSRKLKYMSSV